MSSALYYLFKKTAFIILVSLAAVSVFSAELKTKIAVCGYEPLADILTTKLSENDRFDMLERSQISRVLKEQKINAQLIQKSSLGKCFPHADIFVILSSAAEKNREYPSGIVIFNAKNGAQLVNEALPKDLSRAVEASLKAVNSANEKLNSGKLHAVSISAVRDTGVSKDERYKIAETASLIERGIGASPDIQILERSHLERVVKERTVTDKELPLDASALFIRLEYIPDANRKSTDLRITLTDVERKVLFSYEIKDCFLSPVKTSGAAVEKICGFLKINPPQKLIDSKKEAARFYAEYQNLTANGVAKKDASPYLFASLAIDHNSFEARKAELFYYAEFLGDMQWNERIPALWETLDNMKLFIRDFPDAHKRGEERIHSVIGDSRFMKGRNSATPEQLMELEKYADAYRAFHFENCAKSYKFDLSDGINSLEEAKQYCLFVALHQDYYLFCSPASWYWKRYRINIDALKLLDKFAVEHPETRKDLEKYILDEGYIFPSLLLVRNDGEFDFDRKISAAYFSDFSEFRKFAEMSVFKSALVFAAEADCFKMILLSNRTENSVNGILIDFFEKMQQLEPAFLDRRDLDDRSYKFLVGHLIDFLRDTACCLNSDVLTKTMMKVQAEHNILSDLDKTYYLLSGLKNNYDQKRLAALREITPLIRKYSYLRATSRDIFMAYYQLYIYLTNRYENKAEAEAFINELNKDFEMKTFNIASDKNASYTAVSTFEDGDCAYVLMLNHLANGELSVYKVEKNSDDLKAVKILKLPFHYSPGSLISFSANDGYVFCFTRGKNAICNAKTGNIRIVEREDSSQLSFHAFVNGRIYMLSGPNEDSVASRDLISMLPDGSDVKTHFSSLRDTKLVELDSLDAGVFSNIIPLKDGKRFIFAVSDVKTAKTNVQQRMTCYSYGNPLSGLYLFDTEKNECSLLCKLPLSIKVKLRRVDGNIQMLAYGMGEQYYEISEPDLTLNLIASRCKNDKKLLEEGKMKYYLDIPDSYPTTWSFFPFLIKDGYLWNAGSFGNYYAGMFCVDLKDMKKTPCLFLPCASGLFAWKDYVVIPGKNVIVAIKPKKLPETSEETRSMEGRKSE